MGNTYEKGRFAEKIGRDYLRKNNYLILASNWRANRYEIDIIAYKKPYLAFVEVKFRNKDHNHAAERAVNRTKQKRIINTAMHYLEKNSYKGEYRFDILAISNHPSLGYSVEHLKDAYWPGLRG
jgi:putative endonuclease